MRDAAGEPRGAALAYSDVTDLVQALTAREVFESSVSHELRTPLTAVLGHLEMVLEEEEGLPAGVTTQLQVVQRNAERLRCLVSDLLDPAARGRGTLALVYAPADVTALVGEVISDETRRARDAGIELIGHTTTAVPAVLDAHRVRQVLDNVVSNAVKYTDPGGRVDIWVESTEDDVVVTVTDTGIGIAPEALTRLWEPFFRADQARERVTPGVGLGLGIARSVVTAHAGEIEVFSRLGQGSTFRITLPRAGPPALATAPPNSAPAQ